MNRDFDPTVLSNLNEPLRKRVEQVLEKDITEFTSQMPINQLDEGDVKVGELTYTELVLLTAASMVGMEGNAFYTECYTCINSKEWQGLDDIEIKKRVEEKQAKLDQLGDEYKSLVELVSKILFQRLEISKEVFLDYTQDYSIIKPAKPYPRCPDCGERKSCALGEVDVELIFISVN